MQIRSGPGACVTSGVFVFLRERGGRRGLMDGGMIDRARVRTTGYHTNGRNPIAEGRLIIACVIVANVYGGSYTHTRARSVSSAV